MGRDDAINFTTSFLTGQAEKLARSGEGTCPRSVSKLHQGWTVPQAQDRLGWALFKSPQFLDLSQTVDPEGPWTLP